MEKSASARALALDGLRAAGCQWPAKGMRGSTCLHGSNIKAVLTWFPFEYRSARATVARGLSVKTSSVRYWTSCCANGSTARHRMMVMAPSLRRLLLKSAMQENGRRNLRTYPPLQCHSSCRLPDGPRLARSMRSKSINGRLSSVNRIHFHWLRASPSTINAATLLPVTRIETIVLSVTPW